VDEWNWVRRGSSWSMGLLPVRDVVDFARRSRWRTMGLWSMGGPDFDLRVREGLGVTWQVLTFEKYCFATKL